MRPRVYLAGKITGDWWRNELLDADAFDIAGTQSAKHLPLAISSVFQHSGVFEWPVIPRGVLGVFDYVGPYVVDVWGGHGNPLEPMSHGFIETARIDGHGNLQGTAGYVHAPGQPVLESISQHWSNGGEARALAVEMCLHALHDCDIVFAWIDRLDIYATLVELGYAKARGKIIWIGYDYDKVLGDGWRSEDRSHELWFTEHLVCDSTASESAAAAFRTIWERNQKLIGVPYPSVAPDLATMPYQDYLKTEHWQAIRHGALDRAGSACQTCRATTHLHVHHNTYERRGCEEPGDVVVLCAECHRRVHDVRDGRATRRIK